MELVHVNPLLAFLTLAYVVCPEYDCHRLIADKQRNKETLKINRMKVVGFLFVLVLFQYSFGIALSFLPQTKVKQVNVWRNIKINLHISLYIWMWENNAWLKTFQNR